MKYTTLSELGLAGMVLVLVIALPLLAVTLKEPLQYALSKRAGHTPHSENMFMAFIESMIEAFEAVLSYLANTISFVRLAAYAMSHAAILMATFAVADAVAEAPAVGGVLYVLVVIVRQRRRLDPGGRCRGRAGAAFGILRVFRQVLLGNRPAVQAFLVSRQGEGGNMMQSRCCVVGSGPGQPDGAGHDCDGRGGAMRHADPTVRDGDLLDDRGLCHDRPGRGRGVHGCRSAFLAPATPWARSVRQRWARRRSIRNC